MDDGCPMQLLNPLTPKISLVILLIVCQTILTYQLGEFGTGSISDASSLQLEPANMLVLLCCTLKSLQQSGIIFLTNQGRSYIRFAPLKTEFSLVLVCTSLCSTWRLGREDQFGFSFPTFNQKVGIMSSKVHVRWSRVYLYF